MKKYKYKVYNSLTGYTWDTIELEIVAHDKDEAYKKAFKLAGNHDYQELLYPYLLPIRISFRLVREDV